MDIAQQVAAHDAQIEALIAGQKATNENLDRLATATREGFEGVYNRINASTAAIETKVDAVSKDRANDRAWNWQNVSAAFGIIAALIGAAMYTMNERVRSAESRAESARQLDKAVFETHLAYYQRDFSRATSLLENVATLATTQTQQIAAIAKDSEWRSDLNAERLDRLNSEVARQYRMISGNDLPFINTQPRGPKQSDATGLKP